LWGTACQRVRQDFIAGNVELGRAFMLRFQEAIDRILSSGSAWTFLRAAMRLKYNLDIGLPRAPLGVADKPWNDSDVERILQLVDAAK
jgi:N-acetylneuraminate lyase